MATVERTSIALLPVPTRVSAAIFRPGLRIQPRVCWNHGVNIAYLQCWCQPWVCWCQLGFAASICNASDELLAHLHESIYDPRLGMVVISEAWVWLCVQVRMNLLVRRIRLLLLLLLRHSMQGPWIVAYLGGATTSTEQKCAMGGNTYHKITLYNKIATSIFLNINQRNKLFWLPETK